MKVAMNQKSFLPGPLMMIIGSMIFLVSCNNAGKSDTVNDTLTKNDTTIDPKDTTAKNSKRSFFSVVLSVQDQRTLFQLGSQSSNEVKMIRFDFDPAVAGGFGLKAIGLDKDAHEVAGTEVSLTPDLTGLRYPNTGGSPVPPEYSQSVTRGHLKHLLDLRAADEPIANPVELRLTPCFDPAMGKIYYVITNTANPTTVCPDPRPENAVGRVGSNPSPPDGQPCLEECDSRNFKFKTSW